MVKKNFLLVFLSILIISTMTLSACGGSTAVTTAPVVTTEPTTASTEPIKIGVAAPFSGTDAWNGDTYMLGVRMAVDEINASGGILGRKVEVFTADNACDNSQAVAAVRKLIDLDKVDVIMGSVCSGCTLAAMPVIAESKIADMTVNSTNPDIYAQSGVGGNIWQFRMNIDDRIIAETYGKMIFETSKNVAALAINDDWGRGAVGAYKKVFDSLGANLVSEQYFDEGSVDYGPIITNIKNSNAGALLLIMEYKDGVPFLRQMNELGVKIPIFSRGSMVDPALVTSLGDDAKLANGIMEATFSMVGVDPAFDKAFYTKYGDVERGHAQEPYYGVYVIKAAIELMGKADRASIRDGLEKVDITTGIGRIKFDDHHQAYPNLTIGTFEDEEVVLLKVVPTAP
jgi:branched-chain amino acid transport system substrate-binding protein